MPRLQLLQGLIQADRIDDEAALVAYYDWKTWWARESQLAPLTTAEGADWFIWLLLAGRGFGKTRTGVEWLIDQAAAGVPEIPMAIVGRTSADVRDVLIEGPAGIKARSPPWFRPHYEPSKRRVTWPNGVYATTFSAEEPDQLRGPQFGKALADEIAAWPYFAETWSNLLLACRLGASPKIAALTTPRPLPQIRALLKDPKVAVTRGRTIDNAANLSKESLDYLKARFEGTRLGRQELEGEMLDDLPGALWTQKTLDACRSEPGDVYPLEMFERIVVAVDPSGSDGEEDSTADAQGIVAAGKVKGEERYVVLKDRTDNRSPEGWAQEACTLYNDLGADVVVGEKNYGGDMVRAVIQAYDRSVPVKLLTASRGKHVRAEPVALLYEQGKVKHAPGMGAIESQYAQFTNAGYMGGASPNNADAAIWCILELAKGALNRPRIRSL